MCIRDSHSLAEARAPLLPQACPLKPLVVRVRSMEAKATAIDVPHDNREAAIGASRVIVATSGVLRAGACGGVSLAAYALLLVQDEAQQAVWSEDMATVRVLRKDGVCFYVGDWPQPCLLYPSDAADELPRVSTEWRYVHINTRERLTKNGR